MAVSTNRQGAQAAPTSALGLVAVALTVAVAIELVVLRTGTRSAIHIPALEQLAGPYEVAAAFGRYAYYASVVLGVAFIALLVPRLWASPGMGGRIAAVGVGVFAAAAAGARLAVGEGLAMDLIALGAVVTVAAGAAAAGGRQRVVGIALFAAAFVSAGLFVVMQEAVASGLLSSTDGSTLLWSAEVLAVVFAAGAPWTVGASPRRRGWVLAGVAGGMFLAVAMHEPATARFLMLWNTGLPGSLPTVAYAAAAAGLAAGAAGLWVRGRRLEAAALCLLVAGGVGLHSTYQTGLVVAALACLALAGSSQAPATMPATSGVDPGE